MLHRYGPSRSRHRSRGQSLAEFAIVFPVLMLILGGIIQFGLFFWAQNTLTQVVRDTGRWAATQQTLPCDSGGPALVSKADAIALNESLFGYSKNQWAGNGIAFDTSPAPREGIEVSWPLSTDPPNPLVANLDCPPDSNGVAWYVNIRAHHVIPVFFPFIGQLIPGCDSAGCSLSSTVVFRMEPAR